MVVKKETKKKPRIEFRIGRTGKWKTFSTKEQERKALKRFKELSK